MKKILIVIGTRPEAIKMCPVIKALRNEKEFAVKTCSTGQHREMLNEVFDIFDEKIDYSLDIMKPMQTLAYITGKLIEEIDQILKKEKFDIVLVHGDTTTAYVAALAAFYNKVAIGHVEAGLRTYNMFSPYPEEFNRKSIDLISSLYFAPTELAKANLIKEGVDESKIYVTGNTAIDVLRYTIKENYYHEQLKWCEGKRTILLTSHRRENIGEPMRKMFGALKRICDDFDDVRIIYPVHLNPKVREVANEVLGNCKRVRLIEPLNVVDFHNFMRNSYLILTDSGGIQEEAPALDKPVLVMRDTTERPEGLEAGTLILVGTEEDTIYNKVAQLLNDKEMYINMCNAKNPYGDGHASERIVKILRETR